MKEANNISVMAYFRLALVLFLPLVWACDVENNTNEKQNTLSKVSSDIDSAQISGDTILLAESEKIIIEKKQRIEKLITNPFNLKYFKQNAGSANGGVKKQLSFYYKPDTNGTYYEYFWFHALRRKYGESKSVDYLYVETFIYGDKIGQYTTVDEELISIKAKISHYSLGTINLVGKSRNEIEFLYGTPNAGHLNADVYYHQNSFLILSYKDERISWFRYLKTNVTLEQVEELPKDYFEYGEGH